MSFDFSQRKKPASYIEFANLCLELQSARDFKGGTRDWCYQFENMHLITKSEFHVASDWLAKSRKRGYLPIDFVAEDVARTFDGVVEPNGLPSDTIRWMLRDVVDGHRYHVPDYWADEQFYLQLVVEKSGLFELFKSVCAEYRIPIANAKGWTALNQRAIYARRFKEAEERGLECVLLYCGDLDPSGLQISNKIRSNLEYVRDCRFEDGTTGYDPAPLIINRFGINKDFIDRHGIKWIKNLETGSTDESKKPRDLADPKHPDHFKPYVQNYIRKYGARKVEANAMTTNETFEASRRLLRRTIDKYLGLDSHLRFKAKDESAKAEYCRCLKRIGFNVDAFETRLAKMETRRR